MNLREIIRNWKASFDVSWFHTKLKILVLNSKNFCFSFCYNFINFYLHSIEITKE